MQLNEKRQSIITWILPLIVYLLFSIVIFWQLAFLDGFTINADYSFPQTPSGFIKLVFPFWNDILGNSTIERLPQLPLILLAFSIGTLLNLTSQQILGWLSVIFSTSAGIGIYSLIHFCRKGNPSYQLSNENMWGAFFAGFVYMWSPFIVGQAIHPFIRFSHGILPFMALSFFKYYETQQKRFIVLSAILWALITCSVHWIIYGPMLFVAFTIHWLFYEIKNSERQWKLIVENIIFSLRSLFLLVIFYLGYSAFWFLPGLFMGGVSLYGDRPIIEVYDLLYRNATPSRITRFMGNWTIDGKYITRNPIFNLNIVFLIFLWSSILAFLLAMMALYFNPKDRYASFFSLFSIIIFFLLVCAYISSDLFAIFLTDLPFHDYYAWAFRSPKFQVLLLLAVAVLDGYSVPVIIVKITHLIDKLLIRFKKQKWPNLFRSSFFVLLIVLQLFAAWPLTTGDFNGSLTPVTIPEEFQILQEWLEQQDDYFYVLWIPTYFDGTVDWNLNRSIKDFIFDNSLTPVISNNKPRLNLVDFIWDTSFTSEALLLNKSRNIGKYLAFLGIKYVILHDDISNKKKQISNIREVLLAQDDLQLVDNDFDILSVFENENFRDIFGASTSALWAVNNFPILEALVTVDSYHPFNYPLIFAKQNDLIPTDFNGINLRLLADNSITYEDLAFCNLTKKEIISLGNYVDDSSWQSYDLMDPFFRNYILQQAVSVWDIPFGSSGAVSLRKNGDIHPTISLPFKCQESNQWEFFLRKLDSTAGGILNLSIKDVLDHTIVSFEVNTTNSDKNSFNWVHKSVYLSEGSYSLEVVNEFGLNVLDCFLLFTNDQYNDLLTKADNFLTDYPVIINFPITDSIINQSFPLELNLEGIYRFTHKKEVDYQIFINEDELELVNESKTSWKSSKSLQLNGTAVNLTITTNHTMNETIGSNIWLYQLVNESETLTSVFNNSDNIDIRYTLKEAEINMYTTELAPFLLWVTKNYNEFWKLELQGTYSDPFIVNGAILGYIIDSSLENDFKILFLPTFFFEIGFLISLTFGIVSILGFVILYHNLFSRRLMEFLVKRTK
ncbi:MAG: hypothetical protein JSV04_07925 [Candidatus Heimdallarchaeota archaeon]|nr:MAG: hypothetical protein JSV04_07925 [Candidatus Heimdallarchaeota archaeon]